MSNHYPSQPEAVRVFLGYRHPDLDPAAFRLELGRTFMPGTPYMLTPLGLHAYAAAAFDESLGSVHESGLIAYPSRDTYQSIRDGTVRGRMYTQSHGGVYDMTGRRSRAEWARATTSEDSPDAGQTFFLFDQAVDLQAGQLSVLLVRPTQSSEPGSAARVRAGLDDLRERLDRAGCDQAFVAIRDNFVVIWLHWADEIADQPPGDWLGGAIELQAELRARRVVFLEETPLVAIEGSAAFSFIFQRDQRAGLS